MTEQTTSHSQRPELSSAQRAWLKTKNRFPPTFEVRTRNSDRLTLEILDRDASGHVVEVRRRLGFKGFVLKARDANTQRLFAAKFCVPEDYDDQRTEIDESRMAAKLQGAAGLFAIPFVSGRVEKFAEMPGNQPDLVCFLVEWVEGHTIEQIIRHRIRRPRQDWASTTTTR